MAEFCLKCFNELEGTDYTEKQVWSDDDFCEGCGEWKPCVVATHPKPLLECFMDWLRKKKRGG